MLEALGLVNRELGTTTAVITHNTIVGDMADRVVRMADGCIVEATTNSHRLPARELAW